MNIIKSIPPKQPNNLWVSIDSEWTGMKENQLHRPTSGKFGCLTIAVNQEDVYIITDENLVQPALDAINDCVWVIQKASFDIIQLRRHANIPARKKLWDTMLIDRILWNGYYDNFAIDDLARRYLDIEMDKSLQKSFKTSTTLSEEQIEYACRDAIITLQVALEQRKHVSDVDFKVWSEIDRPVLWAILDFQGFAIDDKQWAKVAENNRNRQAEIDSTIPFNPRSHVQVKKWFAEHKVKLDSSDEEHLSKVANNEKLSETVRNMAQSILDSRMYGKRASTYGLDFIADYLERDENGVAMVFAEYDPNKAETSRMAVTNPAMQTMPIRDTTEFRDCFIARPKHKLIIGDWSAQEPRTSAYLSQDKKMIQIFIDDLDIYIEMAKEIFKEIITKKDYRRKQMKSVILGAMYGLSKWGLAKRENISIELADEYLTKFFNMFPGVKRWIEKQQKEKKYVTTVTGRKCWINPYSSQAERNVLNSPIQGSAAEMMKLAIIKLHQTWNYPFPFGVVASIHDELVLDVPEEYAVSVAQNVKDIMEDVGNKLCPGVPFKAEVVVANRWSEKG